MFQISRYEWSNSRWTLRISTGRPFSITAQRFLIGIRKHYRLASNFGSKCVKRICPMGGTIACRLRKCPKSGISCRRGCAARTPPVVSPSDRQSLNQVRRQLRFPHFPLRLLYIVFHSIEFHPAMTLIPDCKARPPIAVARLPDGAGVYEHFGMGFAFHCDELVKLVGRRYGAVAFGV